MASTPVDFSRVRYSPIEGTHFFYDERYPSAIQFLLSGRWESWDVGWVKYKAQDPEIRRIAADAETRLVLDSQSGYVRWPAPPPPGPPSHPVLPNGHAETPGSAQNYRNSPSISHPSPQSVDSVSIDPQLAPSPNLTSVHPHHPRSNSTYNSPYATQPAPVSTSSQPQAISAAPAPAPAPSALPQHQVTGNGAVPFTNGNTHPSLGTALERVVPPRLILSRTRETKILLSLDGDGIRGLSTLLLVESLVNAICVKLGQRLDPHQIFDLTGGSSMGGLTAIMLCRMRMQAHQAREAYKRIARQVYNNKRDYFLSLDPRNPAHYLDAVELTDTIKKVVHEVTGHDNELLFDDREDTGDVFVVSTHIDIGTNKAALMRSYTTRRISGPELDANMTIWQAMRATCIAPRYRLPQPGLNQRLVIEPGLVDHGTAKNNPIRDILYECRKLFRYANDMMIMVSIGTGVGFDRQAELPEMVSSMEDRISEAKSRGEKFEMDHQALMERGWMKYFRFNVTGLDDVPLEEWRHEELIKEKTSAYLAQPEVSAKFYACVDAITSLLLGTPHARA